MDPYYILYNIIYNVILYLVNTFIIFFQEIVDNKDKNIV